MTDGSRRADAKQKKLILGAARDAARDFVYYRRKDDEVLRTEDIVDAVRRGVVSVDEIAAAFRADLITWAGLPTPKTPTLAPRKRSR